MVDGLELGGDALAWTNTAVEGLARDWDLPLDGTRWELYLLACLRGTIEMEIVRVIASIPPGLRDWDRIANSLGRDATAESAAACREEIEAAIAESLPGPEPSHPSAGQDWIP